MDAIELLKHDHRRVEQLLRDYESAASGTQRQGVVEILVRELSKHAAAEELLFYPFAKKKLGDKEEVGLHLDQHMTVKKLLAELDAAPGDESRTRPAIEQLREALAEHIREEEDVLMAELRAAVDGAELEKLGERIRQAKERGPTRPHPAAPDRPPALAMAAPVAGVYDRVRDLMQKRPQT